MTREDALHIAAQLWCKPAHQHKEMDATLATDIAAALIKAHDDAIDIAADECIAMWRATPNERTNSALTSYQQNAIGPGCSACEKAVRAKKIGSGA